MPSAGHGDRQSDLVGTWACCQLLPQGTRRSNGASGRSCLKCSRLGPTVTSHSPERMRMELDHHADHRDVSALAIGAQPSKPTC